MQHDHIPTFVDFVTRGVADTLEANRFHMLIDPTEATIHVYRDSTRREHIAALAIAPTGKGSELRVTLRPHPTLDAHGNGGKAIPTIATITPRTIGALDVIRASVERLAGPSDAELAARSAAEDILADVERRDERLPAEMWGLGKP